MKPKLSKAEITLLIGLVEDLRVTAIAGGISALNELPPAKQAESYFALVSLKKTLYEMRGAANDDTRPDNG